MKALTMSQTFHNGGRTYAAGVAESDMDLATRIGMGQLRDLSDSALRSVCAWNDPNGDWADAPRAETLEAIRGWLQDGCATPEDIRETVETFRGIAS